MTTLSFCQSLRRTFLKYSKLVIDALTSARCISCQSYLSTSYEVALCPRCALCMYPVQAPYCNCCGTPFNTCRDTTIISDKTRCHRCIQLMPPFDTARAYWEYDGVVSEIIQAIKYRERFAAIPVIASLIRPWLLNQLKQLRAQYGELLIVTVPSHRVTLRKRGYHVPHLIFNKALKGTSYKIYDTLTTKCRLTPAQTTLGFTQRRTNLKNALAINTSRLPASLMPTAVSAVVVLDDIFTTGATASEMASVYKAYGYRFVHILTLAHTIYSS